MDLNLTNEEIKLFIERITGNKDFLYIIQPYGISSLIMSGGLSHAVQARKNKKATVFIVSDLLTNLGITWENVAEIKNFPSDMIKLFNKYFIETQEWEGENFIYGNVHKKFEKPADDKNVDSDTAQVTSDVESKSDSEKSDEKSKEDAEEKLNFVDQFKEKVFDLPLDTEFICPTIEKISDENAAALHERYFLDKNKTVVICPYLDYNNKTDVKFWAEIVNELKAKGYNIYTHIQIFYQKPLEGTLPFNVNFTELNYIADKVKCFVGIRNGAFDFLAMSDAKIFSIEAFPLWQQKLKILYPNCNERTFYDTTKLLDPLRKHMAKSNTGAKFKLHHEKISDEDIFYTRKEILNAVIDAVQKN